VALTDSVDETDFYLPEKKGSLNGTLSGQHLEGIQLQSVRVNTMKLSSIIKNEKVDLIKLDIEGGENRVLMDLINTNSIDQVLNLIVEFHQIIHPQDFFLEISEKFKALGFSTAMVSSSISNITNTSDLILSFHRRTANS
jgi:hypothetical protein